MSEFALVTGWRGRIVEVPASELGEMDRLPYDFAHHIACPDMFLIDDEAHCEPPRGTAKRY